MAFFLISAAGILIAVAVGVVKYQRLKSRKKTVYVCERCGEHHCDCTRE